MKDINLSDETIVRLYKYASIEVKSERTGEPVAVILPAIDAPAVEFTEVVKRAKTTPPAVLCPDGEVIGRDESAEKIDAVKRVLRQWIEGCGAEIKKRRDSGEDNAATYYQGRTDSYNAVLRLLGEPIMEIKSLLNPEE